MTSHRDLFVRRLDALLALLDEIDELSAGSPLLAAQRAHAALLRDLVEQLAIRDWRPQVAANDDPIGHNHVRVVELVLDLAARIADELRGPPTPPVTPPPHAHPMAFRAHGR